MKRVKAIFSRTISSSFAILKHVLDIFFCIFTLQNIETFGFLRTKSIINGNAAIAKL